MIMIRTISEQVELKLNREILLNLLKLTVSNIPDDAKIVFSVPGGGDWSNCDIDIDDECPITVNYTIEKQT